MLLFNDIRIKLVVVILILLSSAYWPTNLPSLVVILCALSYIIALQFPKTKFIQGLFLGLIISSLHITDYQNANQALYSQGHDITIKGEIQSLIAFKEKTTSILVQVRDINSDLMAFDDLALLRLSIRDYNKSLNENAPAVVFKQGELWQFDVTLRPPIGRHNEVGYKLEDYALAKGIHAYGKITKATLINKNVSLRNQWFLNVYSNTLDKNFQSLLLALTFGYKGEIESTEWQTLRYSGLAHLMAISGLHIGFVFGIGWWLGKILRILYSSRNAIWLPVIFGCLCAVFYAWLADFSLPTVRALIACFLTSILLIFRWHWPKHLLLLWCLFFCLILNPFSSLSMSFWLSFSAVSVVFISLHLYQILIKEKSSTFMAQWSQVIFIQCGLFIFLAPIQVYFFTGVSYLSPFINLLSVPWVSLFTVPLSLLAVLAELFNSKLAGVFWSVGDLSLFPVWWLAEKAESSWWLLHSEINLILVVIIILLLLRLIVPLSLLVHPILFLIIATLLVKPTNKWQVDFLDVGHGLSVLLSAQENMVIYDTGMKWDNGSIAESVIEPILNHRGIKSVSGLIISHSDNDHAGGREYLMNKYSIGWLRESEEGTGRQPCIKGQHWQEGNMLFTAIWPPKMVKRSYNPHSCVIKVKIEQWTFLLTGDIDAISEMLILNQNEFDDIDVFLVPHHGSNTSSTDRWVKEMKGKVAIVSTGLFTPWNLPSKRIQEKYKEKQIKWLDTAQLGQITITSDNEKLRFKGHSLLNHKVWYRKLFGDNLNRE